MDILKDLNSYKLLGEGEAKLDITDNGVLVSNRKFVYSSFAIDFAGIVGEERSVKVKVRVKTAEGKINLQPYVKLVYENKGNEYTEYLGGEITLVTSDGAELSHEFFIFKGHTVKRAIFYLIQLKNEELLDYIVTEASYEVDDISQQILENKRLEEEQKRTFGAIRWDAYYSVDGVRDISRQVARALSPKPYRYRAPYFAEVVDDKIVFGEATQEQFDRECEYAIEAGIDYFAYCWYRNDDEMCYARRQHLKSKYRDKIKMCAILSVARLDEDSHNELFETMKESCYFKVEERPVVFIFGALRVPREYVEYIRENAMKHGNNEPLIFAMGDTSAYGTTALINRGYSGLSAYGCSSSGAGQLYSDYAAKNEARIDTQLEFAKTVECIPTISCGMDFRPRIDNPVSWMGGSYYVYTPTAEELYKHASNVFNKVKEVHTPVNSVLCYAWNEHDEGGWICPTITVDESGTPVRDENGRIVINRTHLDVFKRAIAEYKEN